MKRIWKQLQDNLGTAYTFPKLFQKKRLDGFPFLIWGLFAFLFIFLTIVHGFSWLLFSALVSGFIIAYRFSLKRAEDFKEFYDPDIKTFGQLVNRFTMANSKLLANEFKTMSDERIFEQVREITSEQLGVDIKKVTADAHFIKDLGMN